MARSQAVAEQIGDQLMFSDFFLAGKAEIALGTGCIQEALALAEQAVSLSQETGSPAAEACARRAWAKVLASLHPPRWDESQIQFAESLRLFETLPMPPEAAQTHVIWGTAYLDRGDPTAARKHWETAAALWEDSGITCELERVRVLIEKLPSA